MLKFASCLLNEIEKVELIDIKQQSSKNQRAFHDDARCRYDSGYACDGMPVLKLKGWPCSKDADSADDSGAKVKATKLSGVDLNETTAKALSESVWRNSPWRMRVEPYLAHS